MRNYDIDTTMKIVILTILILFCMGLGFYAGYKSSENDSMISLYSSSQDQNFKAKIPEWKEYRSDELGLSFSYPAKLNGINFRQEKGVQDKGWTYGLTLKEINSFSHNSSSMISITGATTDYKEDVNYTLMKENKDVDFNTRIQSKKSNEIVIPMYEADMKTVKGLLIINDTPHQVLNSFSISEIYVVKLKRSKYKTAVFGFDGLNSREMDQVLDSIKIY